MARKRARKAREIPAEETPPDVKVPAPIPLRSVLGQPRAIEVIEASLRSGRVHHAWIFHGPEGVGKRTAALSFAALLLDPTMAEQPDRGFDVDQSGQTHRRLASGAHSDLHVVTKEMARYSREPDIRGRKLITIPVGVLREFLIEPAYLAPGSSGGLARKLFIVDEAELMAAAGQNALLKVLEEPPPGTVIILVTSRPERLLPTIRSRSQRVAFTRLDQRAMSQWMDHMVEIDETLAALNESARGGALELADGAPGVALMAARTTMHEWPGLVSDALDRVDRGTPSVGVGAQLASLVDAWAKAWVEGHPGFSKEAANKLGASHLLRLIGERYRRRLWTKELDEAERRRCARAIDLVREAETQIFSNVQAIFVFEDLCGRLGMAPERGAA